MRLTIWQFLGLILLIVAGWLIYSYWWKDQSNDEWVGKMNSGVFDSEEEKSTSNKYEPPDVGSDGWGG